MKERKKKKKKNIIDNFSFYLKYFFIKQYFQLIYEQLNFF